MADPTIIVDGKTYPLLLEHQLTLGELAEAERITGQGYDLARPGALGLLALTFLSIRRVDATVRLADLELLNGDDLRWDFPDGDVDVPPASSAGSSESDKHVAASSDLDSAETPDQTQEPSGTPV